MFASTGSPEALTAASASGKARPATGPYDDGSGRRIENVAWSYDRPLAGFETISGYLAFYADRVDEAWVGEELATPQPGRFYGGWITSRIVGPFKGEPGSFGW